MVYIQNGIRDIYAELDFELDNNYQVGVNYQDFKAGKWIKLSDEQIAFHEANPSASISEMLAMKLNEVEQPVTEEISELEKARQAKLTEIKTQDDFSNKFFVSVKTGGNEVANVQLWMNSDLRNSLLNVTLPALKSDGETTTKLWSNTMPPQSIDVPIDWAIEKIPLLEIYAKRTYDLFCSNTALACQATTIEAINAINVKSSFPAFLTFELNLDL